MIVCELRKKYPLKMLLKISGIPSSTYKYQIKRLTYKKDKDKVLLEEIKEIFVDNNEKYGYLRVTQELKNKGYEVNKKKVQRIMKENNLLAKPKKRSYHSYRGIVGDIAPNIIDRNFNTTKPYEKAGTDVSVFITQYGKLYLSPIIDFHTREVLAYDISEKPDMKQIWRMLDSLKNVHKDRIKGMILHSDQGYQYQLKAYHSKLKELEIIQSMSRKGNCLDNSPTENFFGRLKTEMFYEKEYLYNSLEELKQSIIEYIEYYNSYRIVSKLKISPIQYRNNYDNIYCNKG